MVRDPEKGRAIKERIALSIILSTSCTYKLFKIEKIKEQLNVHAWKSERETKKEIKRGKVGRGESK